MKVHANLRFRDIHYEQAGRQHAGHGEQNARAPRINLGTAGLEISRKGDRDHVGRTSRHVAGLCVQYGNREEA